MQKLFSFVLLGLFSTLLSAQETSYASSLIDEDLLVHANAVVRHSSTKVHIEAIDKMRIIRKTAVTVLNELGQSYGFVGNGYSDNIKIKDQEAIIYNGAGEKIERYRQRDFKDRSMVGSGDLYTDNRLSYLDYTPKEYPYTVVFESEVVHGNTAFVQGWHPVSGFHVSVEKTKYSLKNPAGIPLRFKEANFEDVAIDTKHSEFELEYVLRDHPAYDYEELSPALERVTPWVQVALDRFSLEGVQGHATNWKELGAWEYQNLLKAQDPLPPATVDRITALTADAENDVEKARRIYRYMQENSRYISVQLGIGGWSPVPAAEVDQLKYGDCKGLTNYTRSLLASQGIESYYAVVWAGEDKKSMDMDFASMEGNHVILNIPQEGEDIWLECTSQTHPFNYLGDFTDDRNVLLIKPEGGEVVRTPSYWANDNRTETSSEIHLLEDGGFSAQVERINQGIGYGNRYGIASAPEKDQVMYYKKRWGHLKSLYVKQIKFINNKEKQEFTEKLELEGKKLSTKAGNIRLLSLNFLPLEIFTLPPREDRRLPVEVSRGRIYRDTFQFVLPEGFMVESIPEEVQVENQFGRFELRTELKEGQDARLMVFREFQLHEGTWPAASYEEFRNFMNSLRSMSNSKAVIARK